MGKFLLIGIGISQFLLVSSLVLAASVDDRRYLFRRPRQIVRSLVSMCVVMPLVAMGLAAALDLHPAMKIALVALSVSPVPPALPTRQKRAGASAGYAIGLLLVSALFSVVFIPLSLELIGGLFRRPIDIPPGAIFEVVLSTILLPLGVGMLVRRRWPRVAERLADPFSKLGTLLLLVCVVPILILAGPATLAVIRSGTFAAITVFSLVGLVSGHLLGGPDPKDRTVLALSTAMRHPAVAFTIAKIGFPTTREAAPAVLLILVVNLLTTTLYLAWRRRRESGSKPHPRAGPRHATSLGPTRGFS